ncbi:MAG: FliG C-terminal domain-containing protein [Sedimentisphaerales bacterium]
MSLSGKQKAAMLLLSLDAATASELVKGLDTKAVQDLAVELAYLDAAGLKNNSESFEIAQQFCNSLDNDKEFQIDDFLGELLKAAIGEAKAENVQAQIRSLLHKRDPFIPIRSANSQILSTILGNEHPQAVAVVLSELPAKKSSEVLGLLDEGIRFNAISRMAKSESVTLEAKMRIAETICKKLEALSASMEAGAPAGVQAEQPLRKVAVILRNLSKDLRDGLVGAIKEKDAETGDMVSKLMIIWKDIPLIADRSLQESVRAIDSRKMALALHKAEESIVKKIKSNISERAIAALDEEVSLMSSPKKEDIEAAREEIVNVLRERNDEGELAFIEE